MSYPSVTDMVPRLPKRTWTTIRDYFRPNWINGQCAIAPHHPNMRHCGMSDAFDLRWQRDRERGFARYKSSLVIHPPQDDGFDKGRKPC